MVFMAAPWLEQVLAQISSGQIDPFDTKEDYEVLNALFIGNDLWEQDVDFHIAKIMRIIQAIG
jgi:hypothetical protein